MLVQSNKIKFYAAYKAGVIEENICETYFVFLANIILDKRLTEINAKHIQDLFNEYYQITLPLEFIRQVLGVGVANKSIVDKKGNYIADLKELEKYKIDTTNFEKQYEILLSSFDEFCKTNNYTIANESIETNIINFLDTNDSVIIENDLSEIEHDSVSAFDCAWYAFIKYLSSNNNSLFDFLVGLCVSNITRQSLFYTADNYDDAVDYSGLTVYLDTPVVFALLGMDSEERKASYLMLVESMQKAGCNVQVLDMHFQEIDGIANRAARWATSNQYNVLKANKVATFFRNSEMETKEINEFCLEIENKLNDLSITIKETKYDFNDNVFQEDEAELQEMIKQNYNDQNMTIIKDNERSIGIDVRAVIMVYRERAGQTATRINKSKHILLTSNYTIANVAKKYESNRSIYSGHVPACVSVDIFGTLLWLSTPKKLIEYNRKKLLADCYTYLKPSKKIIAAYQKSLDAARVDDQIDEKRYLLMSSHKVAMDALMDITHGDYARFNDRTYIEVYDQIKANAEKKYNEEKTAHKDTEGKLATETAEREKTVAENKKLQDELLRIKKEDFEEKVLKWGWFFTIILFGAPYIFIIVIIQILTNSISGFSINSIITLIIYATLTLIVGVLCKNGKTFVFRKVRKFFSKKEKY